MKSRSMISLYSGAGGMDYGFEAAGFETRAALEIDKDAAATLRLNRQWPVIEADISETPSSEILKVSGLDAGEVDLLIGGPPCQPFSKAGYWASGDSKRLEDPRARTLDEYMRVVRDALPKVFVLENVHGISYSGKEEGMLLLKEWVDRINAEVGASYAISWSVLNSAQYGVPQVRNRFFMVGHRGGMKFQFPAASHSENASEEGLFGEVMGATQPFVTAWDAIGHLPAPKNENLDVKGRWADLLPSIPEGENYLWHTDRRGGLPLFGWRRRYWSFLLKLAKGRPSWTIQAQPGPAIGPFHWESRRLSVLEMAQLQTFPEGIHFAGSRNSIQRQLGNAVPSLLAEVLGREIRRQFFGETVGQPTLHVPVRRPIPAPEPTTQVPKKFLHLVGNHKAHPGTGLGNSRTAISSKSAAPKPETGHSIPTNSLE